MKILIIDKFFQKHDLAQVDMYRVIAEHHKVTFSVNPMADILKDDYDLLYLGLYHQSLENDLDISALLFHNRKPVIVDQADNEEFIQRNQIRADQNIKWVLSRYLPNGEFEGYCHERGLPYAILPWYVNPDRFPMGEKTNEIAFIASMYGNRNDLAKQIRSMVDVDSTSYIIGEYWGAEYRDILSKSRMLVVECGRKCLTQKYIEGALAGCILVGDKPLYPANQLKVSGFFDIADNVKYNRDYILSTFANKEWFLERFNELLK